MDYEQFKIQSYNHWDLYLHLQQYPYLGRSYAAASRANADVITDITAEECNELFFKIIPAWNHAIHRLFGKFRPNVAILGNDWPHLHAHLIPRFQEPKEFYGIQFVDPNPRGNYAPYPKLKIATNILLQIKEDISAKL